MGTRTNVPPPAHFSGRRPREERVVLYVLIHLHRGVIERVLSSRNLSFLQALNNEPAASGESFHRSVSALLRYPGLCRYNPRSHSAHTQLWALANARRREQYEALRAAYNPMRPARLSPAPPFEECTGVSDICDHPYCMYVAAGARCERNVVAQLSAALAHHFGKNLRKVSKDKEGLEVYGMLKEGIGFKDYQHGPMDAGTKLKVKFRTGDIALRERRRGHRTVENDDDEFKCDWGFEGEDRVHVIAECPLYKKERGVYVTELGKVDRTYREMFEAWNREERTVAVLGHKRWVEKAGRDIVRIDRLGKTILNHLWQSRKERLAIGDRSSGNNAPSSRGRVVIGPTAKACKT
ncbi:unnamed protein product [Ectocarpus sp. CCAP 1310/34]|nr:unnamed protein product [Ectocarpus sp. CCAP 1310/34]